MYFSRVFHRNALSKTKLTYLVVFRLYGVGVRRKGSGNKYLRFYENCVSYLIVSFSSKYCEVA